MAPPTTVITVVKRFNYRGNASEEWSNQYAFTGPTPADSAAWRTLFDALVLQEKTLYLSGTSVVRGYAYDKWPEKGDHSIWSVDLTTAPNTPVPGTLGSAGGSTMPGDVAVWIRWKLDRLTSKGKPIYLRKYYHGVKQSASATDQPESNWITAATAFGTKMRDGTFAGTRTITDALGTPVIGAGVSTYLTTRTLKRRPKRPPVAAP